MLRTQSDARLVDLVRAGHASAFEAIVHRYRKPLLGYCSRLLPASRAEDAVQQTFLKAYQSMVSGDAELNLRPWLYRIAHNASLNLLRQNGWSHDELDENMDGVLRPDQALELRERLRATVAAVNALPERQRDAVLLREIDGLSYEEIALALGVGDGAVRQLLHRARATLRAGLTAATPLGLVERLATAMAGTGADPSTRVAEIAAGVGLGTGAVKLGAAVLATGVIATGAVSMPLEHHSRHGRSHNVAAADAAPPVEPSASGSSPAASGPTVQVDDRTGSPRHRGRPHREVRHRGGSGDGSNSGHGGPGERHSSPLRSGGDDGTPSRQEHPSGTDGGTDRHGGSNTSGDGSGSSDRSGSDDHSGTGGGGSGDSTTTTTLSGGGEHQSGDGGGSDDGGTVTTPTTGTTGITGPVTDQSGKDGGGDSGSGTSGGN